MRSGQELIRATKLYASDKSLRSWWCILSTAFLLLVCFAGTLWNFHLVGKALCSVLAVLLMLRLFVIYLDQQHYAIFPRSRLAETLIRLFGLFALCASSIW